MHLLKRRFSFDAAHVLQGYPGKCSNIHGHRFEVIVRVEGSLGSFRKSGVFGSMLIDFAHLKEIVSPILDELDHALLLGTDESYDALCEALKPFGYRIVRIPNHPTSEEICRYLFNEISKRLAEWWERNNPDSPQAVWLRSVTVFETESSSATVGV